MAALLGSVGIALADDDVRIRLFNRTAERVATTVGLGDAGDELYDVQEGAHTTITDTTGEEIEHDYIWICVGDECVPVDPVRFSN